MTSFTFNDIKFHLLSYGRTKDGIEVSRYQERFFSPVHTTPRRSIDKAATLYFNNGFALSIKTSTMDDPAYDKSPKDGSVACFLPPFDLSEAKFLPVILMKKPDLSPRILKFCERHFSAAFTENLIKKRGTTLDLADWATYHFFESKKAPFKGRQNGLLSAQDVMDVSERLSKKPSCSWANLPFSMNFLQGRGNQLTLV